MKLLTTYEAANKYGLSARYLRVLLSKKRIDGREAKTSRKFKVWLIDEDSLRSFVKTKRKRGRPKKDV